MIVVVADTIWPDENIDMSRFATCNSTEPTTCLDASKAHIFTGLCGLSRHRLYTSDNSAKPPSAPWMKRANGPSSSHSPFFTPGCFGPFPDSIAAAVVAEIISSKVEEEAAALDRVSITVGVGSMEATAMTGPKSGAKGSEDAAWSTDVGDGSNPVKEFMNLGEGPEVIDDTASIQTKMRKHK